MRSYGNPSQSGHWLPGIGLCLLALFLSACGLQDPRPGEPYSSEAGLDWPVYHGSAGATHYSPLTQINTKNVAQLQVAWTYDATDAVRGDWFDMQSNPLIIRGRLLFVSPSGRVICLDGATGQHVWAFDPLDAGAVPTRERSRGVAYWTDGREERVLFTFRHYLLALDFTNGQLIRNFGRDGRVDLREGLGRDPAQLSVSNVTPGAVYRDSLILGSTGNTPGHIRAFDVRTGGIKWTFHTIPYPGEFGYETWPADAWQRSFGANAWAGLTLDLEAGTVFVPTASGGMATKDFYGADRLGDNLFANSIVALDAATGERRWHFQTVRHDLWDRDLPAQPTLVTVRRNGKKIPALAQVTKSGFVFILDRRTGASLFELEERAAFGSDVPGEVAAKTQIVPRAPAPFARQLLTADLLTRRTPEAQRAVAAEFSRFRSRGLFDPPSLQGTVVFPGFDGGAEWGGAAYDPQTGLLYVNANEMAWIAKLNPRAATTMNDVDGRGLYLGHCASCHGADLRGSPPEFPALVRIGQQLSEAQISERINSGGGRMPGFRQLKSEAVAAITRYLIAGPDALPPDGKSGSASASTTIEPGERFVFDGYKRFLDPDRYPAVAPPWGTLSAIDVSTGRYAWQIPFGEFPQLVAQGITNTGSENYGGAVVTAGGLLFIGATIHDHKFHAYDKLSGRLLWHTQLPAAGVASPATYMIEGRQFVVIGAAGKDGKRATMVAFALPP